MRLARMAGLDAATVRLTHALDKDVLLIDRFDRPPRLATPDRTTNPNMRSGFLPVKCSSVSTL
jgi:hypothetical protein